MCTYIYIYMYILASKEETVGVPVQESTSDGKEGMCTRRKII